MIQFKEDFLEVFLQTAVERHRIYIKKEKGLPKPWTEDVVFRDFFFCNLFRQYDKCSKWIIKNIVPYDRWDLLMVYRFISTYETFKRLELILSPRIDSLEEIEECLEQWSKHGKIFSGCFIRNPSTSQGAVQTYRAIFQVIRDMKKDGWSEDGSMKGWYLTSLERMCRNLKKYTGIGGFMAYEYACDFAYTGYFNPTDKDTWANMGPGAKRGMSFLLYGNAYHNIHPMDWLEYARDLLPILRGRIKVEFPNDLYYLVVSMREVEHWLCEYQKYKKYHNFLQGGDKVKHRKYDGRSNT